MDKPNSKNLIFSLLFLLCITFILTWNTGNRPFATPDEARYVEIPREMITTNNFVTPRLNAVKYFEKPPFVYWVLAGVQKIDGLKESSSRLAIALFALLGCAYVFIFCKKHLGIQTAFLSTGVLASTILYTSLARLIILDMPLSVLLSISLLAFYQAFQTPSSWQKRFLTYLFSIGMACGVLTKGIVVLAIGGPIIVTWLTITKNWRNLLPTYLPSSIILFFAIVTPWHILASLENPEFLHKYFIVEHFLRYTTTIHSRYQPAWFFIPVLLIGLLPWTGFVYRSIKDSLTTQKPLKSFLMVWFIWVTVFFSFSNSKLIPYILPAFPPLAIMIGHYLNRIFENNVDSYQKSFLISACVFGFFAIGVFLSPLFFPELHGDKALLLPYLKKTALVMGLLAIICLLVLSKKITARNGIIAIFFAHLFTIHFMTEGATYLQKPSLKPFADIINKYRKNGEIVVSYASYFQDLPVYTKSTVTVVNAESELKFGTEVEDTSAWMIKSRKFSELFYKVPMWIVFRANDLKDLQKKIPGHNLKIVHHDGAYTMAVNSLTSHQPAPLKIEQNYVKDYN